MFKVAIIGRPNVGKSTLFNRLIGKSFAIVDDIAGVTRDRKEAVARLGSLEFMAIDTAGLEQHFDRNSLNQRMVEQTELAIGDADLCLFVVDGKSGIQNDDFYFANWLRKTSKNVILVANKCENFNQQVFDKEFYKLGFGKPIAISAEHKIGFIDLHDAIDQTYENYQKIFKELASSDDSIDVNDNDENDSSKNFQMQIAVIGKPNAGKSSFINQILKTPRLIIGQEAGITRDAIAIDWTYKNQKIRLIDTAGIRKKSNINQKLEKLSVLDSYRAIRFAQVVILLIDCNSLLDHQDVALASQVLKEGRVLIFGINKIDCVTIDKELFMQKVRQQIQDLFPEISGSPILGVSAKSGYNVEKIIDMALASYHQWQAKISTSKINDWLEYAKVQHSPKMHKGKPIKIKYASQIKSRPPTFVIFTNHPQALGLDYQRYLLNSLRKYFELNLTPIRIYLRKSENPFAEKKEKTFSKKVFNKK
jgi:GTP-binding protein